MNLSRNGGASRPPLPAYSVFNEDFRGYYISSDMRQRPWVGDNLLRLAIVSSNNGLASRSGHPLLSSDRWLDESCTRYRVKTLSIVPNHDPNVCKERFLQITPARYPRKIAPSVGIVRIVDLPHSFRNNRRDVDVITVIEVKYG